MSLLVVAGTAAYSVAQQASDTEEAAPEVRIIVGIPGQANTDDPEGTSPFEVEFRIDSNQAGGVLSVVWDLGDGTPQMYGLVVPHTYVNTSSTSLVFPVSATVTMRTADGSLFQSTATRVVTVLPGTDVDDDGVPDLPGTHPYGDGGAATPCGLVGLIPLLFSFGALAWMRRRPNGGRRFPPVPL